MERTLKCLNFQLARVLISAAIFTTIYLVIYFAIMITISFAGTPANWTSMGYCSAAIIFMFITFSTMHKGFFNNLLLFGNTRSTISSAFSLCCIMLSALLGLLSVLIDLLNNCIANSLHMNTLALLSLAYPKGEQVGSAGNFLWYFTLLLMISFIALLYATLSYKIGKRFIIGFWCGGGLLSMLTSLLSFPNISKAVLSAIQSFLGIGFQHGIFLASLHFFIVAVVFGTITWLIARRQPQIA